MKFNVKAETAQVKAPKPATGAFVLAMRLEASLYTACFKSCT